MTTYELASHNKALMQEIFDGVARGDARLFVSHLADNATMTITGLNSWSRVFEGKQHIMQLFGYVRSRLAERGKTHAYHFLADGDWVVVEAKGDMLTAGGEPYRNHYCLLYRLADDQIVEIKEYQDTALAEERLGACPQDLQH